LINKALFVTSGQPALNPRLVKEADALINAGYDVTIIYSYWNDWGDDFTQELSAAKKWKIINTSGHPTKSPSLYLFSKLLYKLTKWCFINLSFCAEDAVSRSAWFLTREAKKHAADLYIGHNLGALPAVVKAAKKFKAKCGFDAEDFHRQEVSNDINSFNYKIAKFIEDKYFPGLNYITASSPQIADKYRQLYPHKHPVTILNVFPKSNIRPKEHNTNEPLKLFWFSQTIGPNRGLETVAKALKSFEPGIFELHLLGYITSLDKQSFIKNELSDYQQVIFHDPIPPDEVVEFAAQFDIGLATEKAIPLNRDICLTNKIFTYLNAGLAIIASNTTAQSSFMNANPEVGKVYEKENIQSLITILSNYHSDREVLNDACMAALKIGNKKLNWENESISFVKLVNDTLSKIE